MKLNRKNDMPVGMEEYSIIVTTYKTGRVETSVINYYQGFRDTGYFEYLKCRRDKIKTIYRIDVDTKHKDGYGHPITAVPMDYSDILWAEKPVADEEIPLF